MTGTQEIFSGGEVFYNQTDRLDQSLCGFAYRFIVVNNGYESVVHYSPFIRSKLNYIWRGTALPFRLAEKAYTKIVQTHCPQIGGVLFFEEIMRSICEWIL